MLFLESSGRKTEPKTQIIPNYSLCRPHFSTWSFGLKWQLLLPSVTQFHVPLYQNIHWQYLPPFGDHTIRTPKQRVFFGQDPVLVTAVFLWQNTWQKQLKGGKVHFAQSVWVGRPRQNRVARGMMHHQGEWWLATSFPLPRFTYLSLRFIGFCFHIQRKSVLVNPHWKQPHRHSHKYASPNSYIIQISSQIDS